MDIVYIRDLRIKARIGIYPWEKAIQQQIRVDLEMAWDNRIPAASDKIEDTLNYKTAAQRVVRQHRLSQPVREYGHQHYDPHADGVARAAILLCGRRNCRG